MRRAALLVAITAVASALATRAAAQDRRCRVVQSRQAVATGTEPNIVGYVSGPLYVQCTGGEDLRADSAVVYQANNEVQLFGRVDYQDPVRALNSDFATYNSQTGRLFAQGSVVFTDKERGSTLRGPQLEYFRALPGRPESQMLAPMRPHLTLVPRAEAGKATRDPLEIDGDQISMVGNRFMTAQGGVVIRGKELNSTAGEASYDANQERLELRRDARAVGKNFALSGDLIVAALKQGKADQVRADGNAHLVNEKLRVDGPAITLFFADDLLQRLAAGNGAGQGSASAKQPTATATGFAMQADSLEALLPAQQLQRVVAIGHARAESRDTAAFSGTPQAEAVRSEPEAASFADPGTVPRDRDLVFGDTLIGYFVQVDTTTAAKQTPRDSAQRADAKTELERMEAFGSARALYRLHDKAKERSDSSRAPGINYVIADTIELRVDSGQVQTATIRGLQRGVYLDPGAAGAADTARTTAPGQTPRAPSGTPNPSSNAPATDRGESRSNSSPPRPVKR